MFTGIRQLCAMSLLCGAALTIAPDGGVKRVTEVLCTAVLVLTLLSPLKDLNFDSYALVGAIEREREAELFSRAEEAGGRLNRLVIEREYKTYIMDKAGNLGLALQEVEIEVQWSLDGLWVPYGVRISAKGSDKQLDELAQVLVEDLGIPYERQRWESD